jgi:hypothetical protein
MIQYAEEEPTLYDAPPTDTREAKRGDYREIWGVVKRDQQSYWTRIGVAFENRDGSWHLRFEYMPVSNETKIHLRTPREREAAG